ncbi:MAG: hypothetical protein M3483_08335, partial [Gemmatimonadota bacterium]|nr:hypothetical protein [Gemmatimonadota bacterium]
HPYGVHVYGEPLSRYLEVRALGWTGPIWATEIGVSDAEARYAGANSDRWQEENVRRVFTQDESRHGWDRIYWFQLTPAPGQWGLLRHPGRQRRPAYEWMRSRP